MVGIRARQQAETRATLLRVGRELFAAEGYAAVGLAAIVDGADLTKGALYHHFDSKAGLFAAVLAQVQAEVGEAVVTAAATAHEPWSQFLAGCRGFLDASTDPRSLRIMLIDGPAVLGWSAWRGLDDEHSGRHLREALEELVVAGIVTEQPVEPLARVLSGALNDAALWVAEDPAHHAVDRVWSVLLGLLQSLRR